ncbi:hypothetical protein SAMN05519103_07667 [Rhizobiales bacterium GAS113]|nr:hypothetical protein SAMN05519103_07667 [Rhizobiales bacterium GAS113]
MKQREPKAATSAVAFKAVSDRKAVPDRKMSASRRTPYLQGQIDGLCGLYAIVNAFQLMFPGTFTDEDAWELMVSLCDAISPKFPAVIWKGAGVEDMVALFKAASQYALEAKHLKGTIEVTRPFANRRIDRVQDFWGELGAWLEDGVRRGEKRLALIGIGYPDNHWTIVTHIGARSVTFFDSWELKRLALRQFTVSNDVAKSNGGMHKLDTRQSFLIARKAAPSLRR